MYSIQTIRDMANKSARQAATSKRAPKLVEPHDVGVLDQHLKGIPFLGDYCPKRWKRIPASSVAPNSFGTRGLVCGDEYLEVDTSGWGTKGELALTLGEFFQWVSEAAAAAPLGFAIVEAGPFQVVVGVYRKGE